MCGRASLTASGEDLREAFNLAETPDLAPRFNIAPTQPIAVVRTPGKLELLRWGLVPAAEESPSVGSRYINARVESAPFAPAFRDAFRARRCLVVVDGFYEWKGTAKGARQPFHVRRADRKPFALAGLWERWVSRDGEVLETCSVLTTDAKGAIAELHDRMPIVLEAADYDAWIDPATADPRRLLAAPVEQLELSPVGAHVNNPANDDPACLAPPTEQGELFTGSEGR